MPNQRGNWQTKRLSPENADRICLGFVGIYVVTFTLLPILRFLAFNFDGYDLSIFDQAVWNSLHGRLLETSILPDVTWLLGQRFSPILLAFVPLYAVWHSPLVLLIVQTLGIGLAALPIYWCARATIGRGLALVIVLAYLLFPPLHGINLFEFHEIALAIPVFSLAMFFLLRRRFAPMLICLCLTLLIKEDMAFTVFMFGVYILLVSRRMRLGVGLMLASTAWSVLLLQYLIPFLNGAPFGTGNYYYFGAGIAAGQGRYDYLGNSLGAMLTTLVTRPGIVLQHVLVPPKVEYVLKLLMPLAGLPLFAPEVAMLALPTLVISLLSDYAPQFSIDYHYSASLVPFLFFALIVGVRRIISYKQTWQWLPGGLAIGLVSVAGGAYYLLAPAPLARRFDWRLYAPTGHAAEAARVFKLMPANAAVAVQGELMPHLAERRYVYSFPAGNYCQPEYVVADTSRYKFTLFKADWDKWMSTEHFTLMAQHDNYLIAKRKTPDQAVHIHFGDEIELDSYTLGSTPTIHGSNLLCPIIRWQVNEATAARYRVEMELEDTRGHLFAHRDDALSATVIQYILPVPPTTPSGAYNLSVSVYDEESQRYLDAHDATGQRLGARVRVSQVQVEKDKMSKTASQLLIEHPFFVDMQEMRLLGYAALPQQAQAGDTVPLGIYWRARAQPRGDYQVAVQLLDADQRIRAEESSRPAGDYATTAWSAGEVVLDWHDLAIPANIPAGRYMLRVVLRDGASQIELGQAPVGALVIGERQ